MWCAFAACQLLVTPYEFQNSGYHSEPGLTCLPANCANNRDLRTFVTSLEHTFRVKQQIPDDVLLVSESGISTPAHIQRLRSAGVGAVLVGESLMRQPNIGNAVRELMGI